MKFAHKKLALTTPTFTTTTLASPRALYARSALQYSFAKKKNPTNEFCTLGAALGRLQLNTYARGG